MADTLPNVQLPADTWVNLYDETGISAGTQVQIQNTCRTRVLLHTGANEPDSTSGFNVIPPNSVPFVNQSGASGEWAYSESADSRRGIRSWFGVLQVLLLPA